MVICSGVCAARHGIAPLALWPRGVDLDRFTPERKDDTVRSLLAPGGEALVGYVGRLAPEKRVELLAPLQDLPGVRLVVIGDGPERRRLQARLPDAQFLGLRHGDDLARLVPS